MINSHKSLVGGKAHGLKSGMWFKKGDFESGLPKGFAECIPLR